MKSARQGCQPRLFLELHQSFRDNESYHSRLIRPELVALEVREHILFNVNFALLVVTADGTLEELLGPHGRQATRDREKIRITDRRLLLWRCGSVSDAGRYVTKSDVRR